ncbi:FecR family protein [Paraflavitalea pollutisoli]|uniref:FecR family protein n=1 Tax=Paraflavitalea pollutisoli TaxID=3034143 RepID=UPI0023EC2C95|nr:FecR domain-containing protein [Paraflavitalea sp. H1-2-19X]
MEHTFSTIEDIIADEAFQAWYLTGHEVARVTWQQRMEADPALVPLVKEAQACMDALAIREKELPQDRLALAEARLMRNLPATPATPVVAMQRRTSRWWWAAAAAVLLAASLVVIFNKPTDPSTLQTAYGEIRKQLLPDGSTVMLNANSEISYQGGWKTGNTREIWLKGEAFFHVAKTPNKAKFIVHTDRFDVEVTGTQFNVMNRAGKTNVMLTEGSVTLHMKDGRALQMKPGDFVEFDDLQPSIKTAKEENVLAWKDKKLYFEKTPLRIAAKQIEELYGVKITLASKQIGDKIISGIVMNDNLDALLQALEAATELHISQHNDEILIQE